jgi:CHAT domain-containing protein/tetratricopeptide (TPR) repeat protein
VTTTVDRSSIARVTHRCARGHYSTVETWVVIDTAARPDLHGLLADSRKRLVRCERCGRVDPRGEPLLALIETPERIVAVLIPGHGGQTAALPAWLATLLSQVGALTVVADAPAAALAAKRELTVDQLDPARATAEVTRTSGVAAAASYGALLTDVNRMEWEATLLALIGSALTADDPQEFVAMLADHPELLEDSTLELLERQRAGEADVRIDLGIELLTAARIDPARAWTEHFARIDRLGGELIAGAQDWLARVRAATSTEQAITLADEALAYAQEVSAEDEFTAAVLELRANAHRECASGRRDEHLTAALSDYEGVLRLTGAEDPARAGRLLNVAVALGTQVDAEPRPRVRRAQELLREALVIAEREADERLLAMIRTNLALALMNSAVAGETAPLIEARKLCEAALGYRSPERDVEDWAYTMINLGAITERLARLGQGRLSAAQAAYEQVLEHADELPAELPAHAGLNLLSIDFDEALSEEEGLTDEQRAMHTERVFALAQRVIADSGVLAFTRGRALRRVGTLHRRSGEVQRAREVLQEAVAILEGTDLHELQQAAWELAALESEEGGWQAAAQAYRRGLSASEVLISTPVERADRHQHAQSAGRLPRWAAHAFVMLGELEEAAVTLENARTRELSRQLRLEDPQLARLEQFVPHAVAAWREAMVASSVDGAGPEAAHALALALDQIRGVPGFERFAMGADLAQVRAAAAPGEPVIYINPSPYGTTLLRVPNTGPLSHVVLAVTSGQVMSQVLFGLDEPSQGLDEAVSFVLAAGVSDVNIEDGREPPEVAPALDRLLPWVGERICAPVHELLESNHDTGALLVACGALAAVPVGAAPYGPDGRCLLDAFTLAATPSASAHAAARRRARATPDAFARLVAVADPTQDLEHARAEVADAAAHFTETDLASGPEGTCGWLFEHAGEASVLHLACHGFGGIIDATESGFVLADRTLTGLQVTELGPLRARLAVASACQSAVTAVGEEAGEAFSLAYALLAAGAACVIASLWPVDDLATAMLMGRLYTEIAAGLIPPRALAAAQCWLRSVDAPEADRFLARHPALAANRARRGAVPPAEEALGPTRHPFAHPEFWAAFIVIGA